MGRMPRIALLLLLLPCCLSAQEEVLSAFQQAVDIKDCWVTFDGTQVAEASSSSSLNAGTNDIEVALKMYATAAPASLGTLINKRTIGSGPDYPGVLVYFNSDRRLRAVLDDDNSSSLYGVFSNTALNLDQWYTVRVVFDRSETNAVIYVDGVDDTDNSTATRNLSAESGDTDNSLPFEIGAAADITSTKTRFFEGKIDSVVYTVNGSVVAEYSMDIDSTSGTLVSDESGNSNDLTLDASTQWECASDTVSLECDSYVANSTLFQGVYDKAVTEGFTLPTCAQCAKLDTFASQAAVSEIIDSTEFLFVYYATEDMGRINWADTSELGTYSGITFTEEEGILASSVNGYFDSNFRFPDDAVYADSSNYGIGVFVPGGTTSWSPNQQWLMGASEFGNATMLYISDIVNPDLRFSGPANNFLLFSTPADSALACGYIAGLGSNNLITAIGSQSLTSTEATPEGYNSTMKTIYIANLNDGSPNSGYIDGNLSAAIFCTGYGLSSYRTSLDTALKELFSP